VLGLAAYSKGNTEVYSIFKDMVRYDQDILGFRGLMENGVYKPNYDNPELFEKIKKYSREDVSSEAQKRLEEVVCKLVSDLKGTHLKIGLAGGIFANVKLNQRILSMENVDDIFVFPNMGDGGLSVGSAYLAYHKNTKKMPSPFTSAFLGAPLKNNEILNELSKSGLEYRYKVNIEKEIATLLASDYVVVRVNGKMEFGPRALGNRSILYKCTKTDVNQWLNAKLNRSEFMPFAPMTLSECVNKYYINISKNSCAAKYMTVTVDCTDIMCNESPAAVHVDRTARPQIITKESYPGIYKILDEYRKQTGFCSIINTSFNMHEEPIVCTAKDAIRAFKDSALPWMAIGNYLVKGVDIN
jgi:carbamoyltransferase